MTRFATTTIQPDKPIRKKRKPLTKICGRQSISILSDVLWFLKEVSVGSVRSLAVNTNKDSIMAILSSLSRRLIVFGLIANLVNALDLACADGANSCQPL